MIDRDPGPMAQFPLPPHHKVSRTDGNIANYLREHILDRFPELRDAPPRGIWFVGSNVWSALYGDGSAPIDADWDVVAVTDLGLPAKYTLLAFVEKLGLDKHASINTSRKRRRDSDERYGDNGDEWGNGTCYLTPGGQVDTWESPDGTILGALRQFPLHSHAHCRAAFSLTDGLVVLPNDQATVCDMSGFVKTPISEADEKYTLPVRTQIRYGAAAVLTLIVAFVLLSLVGCAGAPRALAAPTPAVGTTTVRVERVCDNGKDEVLSSGSGTVIAPGVVLTANHVVDVRCPDGYAFAQYRVYLRNADYAPFLVGMRGWADPAHDLATLRVPGAAARSLAIAAPAVGMRVCAEVAAPARGRPCGTIDSLEPRALPNGTIDLSISIPVILGNSGSGLFTEDGRLVGVVTNKRGCLPDAALSCSGFASSVIGRLP